MARNTASPPAQPSPRVLRSPGSSGDRQRPAEMPPAFSHRILPSAGVTAPEPLPGRFREATTGSFPSDKFCGIPSTSPDNFAEITVNHAGSFRPVAQSALKPPHRPTAGRREVQRCFGHKLHEEARALCIAISLPLSVCIVSGKRNSQH